MAVPPRCDGLAKQSQRSGRLAKQSHRGAAGPSIRAQAKVGGTKPTETRDPGGCILAKLQNELIMEIQAKSIAYADSGVAADARSRSLDGAQRNPGMFYQWKDLPPSR